MLHWKHPDLIKVGRIICTVTLGLQKSQVNYNLVMKKQILKQGVMIRTNEFIHLLKFASNSQTSKNRRECY